MPAPSVPMAAPLRASGLLSVGTRVKIGEFQVTIDRFLSEGGCPSVLLHQRPQPRSCCLSCLSGGFAHVYLVRSSNAIPSGSDQFLHVLKRLAVPDKVQLQDVRKEVDIMVSCVLSEHHSALLKL